MSLRNSIFIFFIIVVFSSCTSYKSVPYFQDLKQDSISSEIITNYTPLTIQPGDMLRIHVTSLNAQADAVFNYNLEPPNMVNNMPDINVNGNENRNERVAVVAYTIDHDGYLHLPTIDPIKVAGLNVDETTKLLESKLQLVLTQPTVSIRIVNLKVSVLGDVQKPNTYTFQDEKLTLNEALAYAGDLNTTGVRNNILLIREVDGRRVYIPIDLTSKKVFTSSYYYLKNNDIIYVKPNKEKVSSSDTALQRISLVISALSILAIFISVSKK